MRYVKKLLGCLTICSLYANNVKDGHPILLKSPVLHLIDGIPYAMDEYAIYDMIMIGHAIRELQNGKKDKTGQLSGKYEFDGRQVTLKELVELEEKCADKNDQQRCRELLEQVKDDYKRIMIKFAEKAKDTTTKNIMTQLIQESCEVRNRKDSYLLSWSRQKDTDFDAMRNEIKTLKECNIFFTDFLNLFLDIIHSCPKGVKRYKEFKHQLEQQHTKAEHA